MRKNKWAKLSDEEIVKLVYKDADVYAELIRRYEKPIFHYIARIINQYKDAEDLTQEAFIKAYENLGGFNFKFKFSSWLYRIAHNLSVNFIKKHYKNSVQSLEANEYLKNTLATNENILQELIGREREDLLVKALGKMPIKYREIIELAYFEEKSYVEIADILKVSVNSVGPMVNRGKKLLKQIVEESENGRNAK